MEGLIEFVESVPEFRRISKGNYRHKLSDILLLFIMARASGCGGRTDIMEFGKHNLNKFRSMGRFMNGIPSEPTLCRIEKGIDEGQLSRKMSDFENKYYAELTKGHEPDIICVDGKALRGTLQENGRNPDIVSAYSSSTGLTLATEACREKSNEITAVPVLLDKVNIEGRIITADAMSMQKAIIDKIRLKGADFVIELKANQRSLRYGIEDKIKHQVPVQSYSEGPALEHGRIETRTYRVYEGLPLIEDKAKWGGNLTVIAFEARTVKKSTGLVTSEERLYISSLRPDARNLAKIIRSHWKIESMHWSLECNFEQDNIKRKDTRAARNLDTIHIIVHSLFNIWRGKRKKLSDKAKGIAELMRNISQSFTKLMRFLSQI